MNHFILKENTSIKVFWCLSRSTNIPFVSAYEILHINYFCTYFEIGIYLKMKNVITNIFSSFYLIHFFIF